MELFNDFKNQRISIARQLVNEAVDQQGIASRDAVSFLLKNFSCIETDYIEELKQEVFWCEENNERLVSRHPGKIPVMPLAAELSWLRALVDKGVGKILFGSDLCQLLREIMQEKDDFWNRIKISNRWAALEYTESQYAELHSRFLRFDALRKNGRLLEYSYRGLENRVVQGRGYVAGFDFWIGSGEVYVAIVDSGWKRAYRCFLARFEHIKEIAGADKSLLMVENRYREIFPDRSDMEKLTHVTVKVFADGDAQERATHMFSSFLLNSETIEDGSTIFYLDCGPFEWGELQQCILALGKRAEVLAPAELREEFAHEIRRAYENYFSE